MKSDANILTAISICKATLFVNNLASFRPGKGKIALEQLTLVWSFYFKVCDVSNQRNTPRKHLFGQ